MMGASSPGLTAPSRATERPGALDVVVLIADAIAMGLLGIGRVVGDAAESGVGRSVHETLRSMSIPFPRIGLLGLVPLVMSGCALVDDGPAGATTHVRETDATRVVTLVEAFYADVHTVRGPFKERFEGGTIDARIMGHLWADRRGVVRFGYEDVDESVARDVGPSISAGGLTLYDAPAGYYCRRHNWSRVFGVLVDETRNLRSYVPSLDCGLEAVEGTLCFAPPDAVEPTEPGVRFWARTEGPFAGAIVQVLVVQPRERYRRTYRFDPARMDYDATVDEALSYVPAPGSIERDVRRVPCGPIPTEGPLPFVAAVRSAP